MSSIAGGHHRFSSQPDSVTVILRFFMDLAPLIVPPVRAAEEERRCEELDAAAARSPFRISLSLIHI